MNNPRKAAQFDYSEYPESGIVAVNNMIGHEAVVECFKLAIRREKEKAGVAVEIPEQTHGDTAERAQQLVEENRAVLAALAPSDG